MSEFIIHNVLFDVANRMCDFNGDEEQEKPVYEYPNHYLGKIIGKRGQELPLYRKRRGNGDEHVPNCVLRNEGGIAHSFAYTTKKTLLFMICPKAQKPK